MNKYLRSKPLYIGDFTRYNSVMNNWDFSKQTLENLTNEFENSPLSNNVITVALAGSFGRYEGCQSSDADYILIVRNTNEPKLEEDIEQINNILSQQEILPPNKFGVFAAPRTLDELVVGIGDANESVDLLGKRMLMLLESRPVYAIEEYEKCLRAIFNKYVEYIHKEPTKHFVFMLNDLIRYFRFICVNYQSTFWKQNEKWTVRNLKLRHSRVLMYSGLLFLLGEMSKLHEDKIESLWNLLHLTPLERIAFVYENNNDNGFYRVIGLYNVFLSKMSNDTTRKELHEIDYNERYNHPIFSELKANSDAFLSELTRFVWARHGQWDDRFFEYLIF